MFSFMFALIINWFNNMFCFRINETIRMPYMKESKSIYVGERISKS